MSTGTLVSGSIDHTIAQGAQEILHEASKHTEHAVGHSDPVVPILLAVSVILLVAMIGSIVADRIGQPPVLGELIAGVVIGNLALLNFHHFEFIVNDPVVDILARIGVVVLLFQVGLETNLKEMIVVGFRSTLVAIAGVVTPFILGYFAIGWIVPDLPEMTKIFMGAVLTATSVGITVRVFKDLNKMNSDEARIVLGAAVIDDILGLIILAIVSGLALTGEIQVSDLMMISAKAILFIVLSLAAGVLLAKRTFKLLSIFKLPGIMLSSALIVCFILAYLANQAGLATIVGAFAAGLVLEDLHFKPFENKRTIEEFVQPIELFFVPIFFVITGAQVNLAVFGDLSILSASLIITVVAIIGKLICGWSFPSKTPVNRALVGAGMIPRGEVGLIFATVGKEFNIVDDRLYAITVIMVILTTLVAPPVLSFLINKK